MKKKPESTITYEIECLHEGVTGSAILLITHFPNGVNKRILVDCGTYQEYEYKEYNESIPFNAENIDYTFLTHTHIDHCGRLPLLVKEGYPNYIFCTNEAKHMLVPALFDCAKILDNDAKLLTKKTKKLVLPLYESDDVKNTIKVTHGLNYNETYTMDENIKVTFLGNGHLMGSSMILIQLCFPLCETVNLLFTGDYNVDNIFQEVPQIPKWVKKLKLIAIEEATYGDSTTCDISYTYSKTILDLISQNKTILSPVIACERSEQVLLKLKKLQDSNLISKRIPIYLAGSLACEYFKIYACKSKVDFIPQNLTLVSSNKLTIHSEMLDGKNVTFIQEIPDEVLESKSPKIILTTSGMADKGKAPYYLSKLLNREDVTILFTCYLPSSTLGYTISNLKKGSECTFNVYGEKIKTEINADIVCCNEFSSHAKADQLLDLLRTFDNLVGVFINHGNPKTKEIYANTIMDCIDVKFVEILDRSIFYSMSGYTVLKYANSKFPTITDYRNSTRKERKERKLFSKKTKPKFKRPNHLCKKIPIFLYN